MEENGIVICDFCGTNGDTNEHRYHFIKGLNNVHICNHCVVDCIELIGDIHYRLYTLLRPDEEE